VPIIGIARNAAEREGLPSRLGVMRGNAANARGDQMRRIYRRGNGRGFKSVVRGRVDTRETRYLPNCEEFTDTERNSFYFPNGSALGLRFPCA
jgi:hypothetical protein